MSKQYVRRFLHLNAIVTTTDGRKHGQTDIAQMPLNFGLIKCF